MPICITCSSISSPIRVLPCHVLKPLKRQISQNPLFFMFLLLVLTMNYLVAFSSSCYRKPCVSFLVFHKMFFFFRLKEVADRINRLGHNLHPALSNLHVGVKRICLGSTCIALLLEDGRVCRISYNILPERLDLSKNDSKR